MNEPACECSGPGFCQRYHLQQGEYAWQLCANSCQAPFQCNEQKSQRYRLKWRLQKEAADRGETPPASLPAVRRPLPPPPKVEHVEDGPGTDLETALESLGLKQKHCRCTERKYRMNGWGIEGCEEHREEILRWLRQEQTKIPWHVKMKAAVLAVKEGLAFKLDPRDPAEGLLNEALRRAREKRDGGTG